MLTLECPTCAEQLRRDGNAAFQAKAFERAIALYSDALAANGTDRHVRVHNIERDSAAFC